MREACKFVCIAVTAVALLAGCVSPPRIKETFPPPAATVVRPTSKSIRVVAVTGGKDTQWWNQSWISNEDFKNALESALEQSGLFKAVEKHSGGDYQISAEILSQEISIVRDAFHNSITLKVGYRLIEGVDGTLIWSGDVSSFYYLGAEDVFVAVVRWRKLQEQAMRLNLVQMMNKISLALGASAEEYNNRGLAYRRKGEYDQAISDFNKAVEINPKYAQSFFNRGVAYMGKGQYDQAISDYTKALEIDPRYEIAYFARGVAYMNKGQYDQAISDLTKAIEINPRYGVAYFSRGRAYYYKTEYDKSWDDIKKAQDLDYRVPAEFLDDLRKASGREK